MSVRYRFWNEGLLNVGTPLKYARGIRMTPNTIEAFTDTLPVIVATAVNGQWKADDGKVYQHISVVENDVS